MAAQAQEVAAQWLDEPASAVNVLEAFDTGAYVRNYENLAPFYRLGVADSSTEVIVSARTGDVIRVTDRVDRVLFWTGNWVHLFRYLDAIGLEGDARRHILTWTALATVIVTLVGLIIAWIRWRPRWGHKPQYSQGRVQPYRTWSGRWHFWSGLIGGVIALTWISSGFLTNLPWQVFTAANLNRDEAARYLGNAQPESLRTWQPHAFGPEGALTVELAWSRVGDEAVLHAIDSDGNRRVLDGGATVDTPQGDVSPLGDANAINEAERRKQSIRFAGVGVFALVAGSLYIFSGDDAADGTDDDGRARRHIAAAGGDGRGDRQPGPRDQRQDRRGQRREIEHRRIGEAVGREYRLADCGGNHLLRRDGGRLGAHRTGRSGKTFAVNLAIGGQWQLGKEQIMRRYHKFRQ